MSHRHRRRFASTSHGQLLARGTTLVHHPQRPAGMRICMHMYTTYACSGSPQPPIAAVDRPTAGPAARVRTGTRWCRQPSSRRPHLPPGFCACGWPCPDASSCGAPSCEIRSGAGAGQHTRGRHAATNRRERQSHGYHPRTPQPSSPLTSRAASCPFLRYGLSAGNVGKFSGAATIT